jgi:hypothetical protein
MQFASLHSHKKNTPVPRWLNCAPMHFQSQIQPLITPTCMNASLHTQNALNQLKWSALLTHSKCTQPTQMKCSPYTLMWVAWLEVLIACVHWERSWGFVFVGGASFRSGGFLKAPLEPWRSFKELWRPSRVWRAHKGWIGALWRYFEPLDVHVSTFQHCKSWFELVECIVSV